MKDNTIPDFLSEYHQGSNHEGKTQIEGLAKKYEAARQDFMRDVYPQKANFQDQWNKLTGQNKKLDPEQLTSHIKGEYGEMAKKAAVQNGYVEKQPTQKASAASQQQPQPNRQQFIKDMQAQRAQQQSRRQEQQQGGQQVPKTSVPQAQTSGGNDRERFMAKMKSMQQSGTQMTQRQRR